MEVFQADLTTFKRDVIVNSANADLKLTDGLAKAISNAGGPKIQLECQKHVKENGDLELGQVFVSSPGSLPCKKVVHTTVPRWIDGNSKEEAMLQEAVYKCMAAADKLGLSSIAIPAPGGGIRGFPVDKCTQNIVEAVTRFLEEHKDTSVKRVALVDRDARIVESFREQLRAVPKACYVEASDVPLSRVSSTKTGNPDCDYWKLCYRYFQTMGVKDVLVNSKFNIWYCAKCHSGRGDDDYYDRGDPSEKYGIAVGWIRVGLATPPQALANDSFKKWHHAYHGTQATCVPEILKVGSLLIPGDFALGGKEIGQRPNHFDELNKPDGFSTLKVFVSPSILYASHDTYATSFSYEDKQTKKTYKGKVAFQVLISPTCYEVGPTTVGSIGKIDPVFDNKSIEWSTKERGSVIIYGLLIRLK